MKIPEEIVLLPFFLTSLNFYLQNSVFICHNERFSKEKLRHGVSPPKIWGGDFFPKKASYRGQTFLPIFKCINAFSSNLNTRNLKIFPNHGKIFTCRLSPDYKILKNLEGFILEVNS